MPILSRAALMLTVVGMIATTTLAVGQAQPVSQSYPVLASMAAAAHV